MEAREGAVSKRPKQKRGARRFQQVPDVASNPPEEPPTDPTDTDVPGWMLRRKSDNEQLVEPPEADISKPPVEPSEQQGLPGFKE